MDQQIWQWTLTKEAVAPCFVRDVLNMRQHTDRGTDFFWLGYTPCRTVLLVGMVVAVQVFDKRAIYTIDDGTAVIDCILRHPRPPLPAHAPCSPQSKTCLSTKTNLQPHSPKKAHLGKVKPGLQSTEPPTPISEPGHPVRVVGRVARHYQSKQIYADTVDPCPSSLDEIAHLECVIELHKTKYSRTVPFVPPALRSPPLETTSRAGVDLDANVFFDTSLSLRPDPSSSYSLPAPPPMPFHDRNRRLPVPTHVQPAHDVYAKVPSSPTASSIASSTPSSPCKPSSPVKTPQKPKLRHPSRLHTRDLTANTFRLYVKHYMDNAPPPFLVSCPSPSWSACGGAKTPTKRARDEGEGDEPTPRPRNRPRSGEAWVNYNDSDNKEDEGASKLGFTLSHLRRVPELALLAARVVRAEARRRAKADREKDRGNSHGTSSISRLNRCGEENKSAARAGTGTVADPPHKKMKRLFLWAVVKLYEEGSIVLWDGDVRPLPVPPPPVLEEGVSRDCSGLWKRRDDGQSTVADLSRSYATVDPCVSVSMLYTSSASAPLYSHYHAPRRPSSSKHEDSERDVIDADADPAYISDPPVDEEAYIPLTPRFLAGYVRKASDAMSRGRSEGRSSRKDKARGANEPIAEDLLAYMQRTDTRWARLGMWAVEEALALLKTM